MMMTIYLSLWRNWGIVETRFFYENRLSKTNLFIYENQFFSGNRFTNRLSSGNRLFRNHDSLFPIMGNQLSITPIIIRQSFLLPSLIRSWQVASRVGQHTHCTILGADKPGGALPNSAATLRPPADRCRSRPTGRQRAHRGRGASSDQHPSVFRRSFGARGRWRGWRWGRRRHGNEV